MIIKMINCIYIVKSSFKQLEAESKGLWMELEKEKNFLVDLRIRLTTMVDFVGKVINFFATTPHLL